MGTLGLTAGSGAFGLHGCPCEGRQLLSFLGGLNLNTVGRIGIVMKLVMRSVY
jgi:hypothetical protein